MLSFRLFLLLLCFGLPISLRAQVANSGAIAVGSQTTVTDPNYVLITGDTLSLQVLEEPELAASQLIDKDGLVRIPLLGDTSVVCLSVRAAEQLIQKAYVDQEVRRAASSTQGQGQDSFFVVDAMLGYRFPKRRGLMSLGIKNLFETRLKFQDDSFREFRDEPVTGPYFPERFISARITLIL